MTPLSHEFELLVQEYEPMSTAKQETKGLAPFCTPLMEFS